jgi:Asp-tRNA(Asn)/Glu-tRNA(Gln) amidotransferase A subunit family amidase
MPIMRNRWLLAATLVLTLSAGLSAQKRTFDLLTANIADIQAAVGSGALTYEKLVQLYLNRIDAYDKKGPRLNAVIQINKRALDVARSLDEERKFKGLRSPLHGIPIAVKDNIDVKDMPSAGGNIAFAGTYPETDATVIRRLREAGAIIFLKTNMDELALGSQGLSSLGGQILNPYDLKRNPGGSSGGTAVSVNVGFAAAGLATETGVSVRSPASNNSLIGIAATQGLVSRAGVIPISFTQDRVGVHAKSVADAALLLSAIRGFDPDDLATQESLGKLDPRPYTDFLNAPLDGARLGVLRDLFRQGEEFKPVNDVIEKEIDRIRDRHAMVIDGLSTGMDLISLTPVLRLNDFEARSAYETYLRRRGPTSPVKSLSDLVASGRYLESLKPRFEQIMQIEPLDTNAEYRARLQNRQMIRQLLIGLMDRFQLDGLIYPFKSLGAPLIGTADNGPRDNPISSITGLPAIVVPAGTDPGGLPVALEFLGRPFTEPKLIQLTHAYEQASHRRVAPASTPHLPGEVFPY